MEEKQGPKRPRGVLHQKVAGLAVLFGGQYTGILALVWEFGTVNEWITSWSKINRAVRYFSRLDPAPMRRRRESLNPASLLAALATQSVKKQIDLLHAWHRHPPCWQCGRKSNGQTVRRLQTASQGLADLYPTNIASYCERHYDVLYKSERNKHHAELAKKWKEQAATTKTKVLVPKARKRLDTLLEAIPDAPPALTRKLQDLISGILEDAQEAFAVEGWKEATSITHVIARDWFPILR